MTPSLDHMIDATPELLLSFGIVIVAISPRMPFDVAYAIGGHLSRPFRVLLLVCCVIRAVRHLSRHILPYWNLWWRVFYAIEAITMGWIFLLTPYLIRCFMANTGRIYIGSPGSPLLVWFCVLSLSISVGVAFGTGLSPHLWALVRLANAASVVPVIRTLQTYNILTTPTGSYRGRGLVISQTLIAYEWYFMVIMLLAVLGEANQKVPYPEDPDFSQRLLNKLRHNAIGEHFWIRALLHIIFINLIDEQSQMEVRPSGPVTPSDDENLTAADLTENSAVATDEEGMMMQPMILSRSN